MHKLNVDTAINLINAILHRTNFGKFLALDRFEEDIYEKLILTCYEQINFVKTSESINIIV